MTLDLGRLALDAGPSSSPRRSWLGTVPAFGRVAQTIMVADAVGATHSCLGSLVTDPILTIDYPAQVPSHLERYYTGRDLHFITCSCYRRRPLLGLARRRDLFLRVLEQTRQRYQFVVVGHVVMPEHVHLLMSEPEKADPSVVMKVVKQRFARRVRTRKSAGQTVL
jgi:REP element-mobilizing transposase RayT